MVVRLAKNLNLQSLEGLVGAVNVQPWEALESSWQERLLAAIAPAQVPLAIAFPETPAALAEVITYAHCHDWKVLVCGAGSKLSWGGLAQGIDLVVSTKRLDRLIEHAVGDLTVTIEAGMSFAELQTTLNKMGQFLPIDPAFASQATLGGIVATADTGSLRHRYGGVRDMLLGITFVRADGQIAKAGGRVVKNVAGYDLMKLFTGAYGTLGILTQLTLRVYPLPESAQTVVLTGSAAALAEAGRSLGQSHLTPTCVDWLSAAAAAAIGLEPQLALVVRFQSITPSVQIQVQRLSEMGNQLNLKVTLLLDRPEVELWQRLQNLLTLANPAIAITCKIGVKPVQAIAFLQQFAAIAPTGLAQLHAVSGLGRLVFPEAAPTETLLKLRNFCQAQSGFLTVLQASPAVKQQFDPWGYTGNALEIMQRLKHQFDPQKLLNPGRFVGGI
jgi:glycolate oxidase FAD binding subunit